MSNPAYTPGDAPREIRSSQDATPPSAEGTGETAVPAIGDRVRHRLSGQTGEVVDLHTDPFVKDLTHSVVNWVGDGDGYGQGYSSTNLIKF